MPRFTGQNKKNKNPRWFLNENSEFFQHAMGVDNRDEAIEAILDFEGEVYGRSMSDIEDLVDLSDEELAQKYASITDTEDYRNMIAKIKMGDDKIDQADDEFDEFDTLPKQSGMGRGMREDLSDREWSGRDPYLDDPDNVDPIGGMRVPTTFQQKLSDQLEDWRSDHLSELIGRGKLDLVNSYIDRLDADRVEEKVAKFIADALEKGENPFY